MEESYGVCNGDVMCFLRGTNGALYTQEDAFFTVTAVKTSHLILPIYVLPLQTKHQVLCPYGTI
jgi:hypothetical protein